MRLRLIRHATLSIEYNGKRLMVDPMLDRAGARPAIQNSPNPRNNPLVPLPVPPEQLVKEVNGVFVTHTHSDHWDTTTERVLPKEVALFGQVEDQQKFRAAGFCNANSISSFLAWDGIEITRTGGQHGSGDIAKR